MTSANPTRLPWRLRLHWRIFHAWHGTRHRLGTRIAGTGHEGEAHVNLPAICFACGNDTPQGPAGPLNATAFRASPGYSSTHDEAGELEIVVCDPCLTGLRGRVTRVITTQMTITRREAWRP